MRFPELGERLREAASRVRDEAHRVRSEAERLRDRMRADSSTLTLAAFVRPNLGPTPDPLRRVLEPIVAASAAMALVVLLSIGVLSFGTFFVVASLIYAILTYVFGLELDLNVPT